MPTSTDTDCVIRLDSLSMLYPTKSGGTVQALDDVSLSVRAGEFISIVGPSGCGKSTLLRIIMGLSRQTSGQVTFGPVGGHPPQPARDGLPAAAAAAMAHRAGRTC